MSNKIKAEIVKTAKSFDGKSFDLWSDGAVTNSIGQWVKGAGAARNEQTQKANLRAGFKVFGNLCVLMSGEVASEIAKARKEESK